MFRSGKKIVGPFFGQRRQRMPCDVTTQSGDRSPKTAVIRERGNTSGTGAVASAI